MLNIIICEDDSKQRMMLEERIKQLHISEHHAVFSFGEAGTLIQFCSHLKGDFIFLMDIVLENDASGIEIVQRIDTLFPHSVTIYISAYLDRVTDIFETRHCYFIYKPELDMRLERAMKKAVEQLTNKKRTLTIQAGGVDIMIQSEEILWIERIKRYSLIHTKTETYRTSESFSVLLERLPATFKQCHRCFVVNFGWVKKHTRTEFIMKDEQWVPISRGYSKKIGEEFQQYVYSAY